MARGKKQPVVEALEVDSSEADADTTEESVDEVEGAEADAGLEFSDDVTESDPEDGANAYYFVGRTIWKGKTYNPLDVVVLDPADVEALGAAVKKGNGTKQVPAPEKFGTGEYQVKKGAGDLLYGGKRYSYPAVLILTEEDAKGLSDVVDPVNQPDAFDTVPVEVS